MPQSRADITPKLVDKPKAIWSMLRFDAATAAAEEPTLASYLNAAILNHDRLSSALSYVLAQKLGAADMNALQVREITMAAYAADPDLVTWAERDMEAVRSRDPACRTLLQPFLYFKGYAALQSYRIGHWLWREGRETLAFHIQSRTSELFGVDIHPAARIGSGILIDHATSVVIGETAVLGDDCSILHEVTLGGTGAKVLDRHPKIGRGVLIGAGAKVLGNITVGDEARIAAGSVVLHDVAAQCTVAGVPAVPIGGVCCEPARNMDQQIDTYSAG